MRTLALIFVLQFPGLPDADTDLEKSSASMYGYVADGETGETLIGTNIYIRENDYGSTTSSSGYYQIRDINPGTYTLRVTYLGYETQEKEITLKEGTEKRFDIDLQQRGYQLEEVTVTSKRADPNSTIGTRTVSMQQAGPSPGVFQDDVFRTIQMLPGITASSDFSSNLNIRGGSPDQTLIQLDQATIYNPTHFFGFFSTFNSDAIKDVRLHKGIYPAKYGGRLGSVVDIYTKEGNRNQHGGVVSLGMLSSRAMVEGPIPNGSYIASFRRSTMEPVLALLQDEVQGIPDEFSFYDFNAKVNYEINDKNKLYASIFSGTDDVDLPYQNRVEFNFRYGNRTFSTSWTHIANSSFFTRFRITGSQYFSFPYTDFGGTPVERANKINELTLNTYFEWLPASNFELSAGIRAGRKNFTFTDKFDGIETLDVNIESWNTAGFVQNEWRPSEQWRINMGVRGEHSSAGDYWRVGPRLTVEYNLTKELRLQAGYGRYYQFMALATNQAFTGFDVWLMTGPDVPPSSSDQFAIGINHEFRDRWKFELEGYYRTMNNLLEMNPFLSNTADSDYHDLFLFGDGYAYGAEVMARRTVGTINGYMAYTYGHTRQRFPGFNQDRYYPPRFDRTHDLTVVLNYELSDRWQVSSTFAYQTGQAYTQPAGRYKTSDSPLGTTFNGNLTVDKVNASRMPAYHRLDFAVTRQGNFFDIADSELQLQVINVYSRRNIWFYTYNFDENIPEKREMTMLPILPSITYTLSF